MYIHFDACGNGPVLAVDFGQSGEAGGAWFCSWKQDSRLAKRPGDFLLQEPWRPSSRQTATCKRVHPSSVSTLLLLRDGTQATWVANGKARACMCTQVVFSVQVTSQQWLSNISGLTDLSVDRTPLKDPAHLDAVAIRAARGSP